MEKVTDEQFFEYLPIRDENGYIVLRIGLMITLYLNDGHQTSCRQNVAACFKDYFNMCGDQLNWATHPDSKQWHDLRKMKLTTPEDWFRDKQPGENDSWQFYYHGGDGFQEASHFCIRGLGSRKWQADMGELSFLSAYLPLDWFDRRKDRLQDLVLSWCHRLKPYHGYAGIGILESLDSITIRRHEKAVYALAKRFPGLEVDSPVDHTLYLSKGIKGVNWLTVLGDAWVERLGGRDKLSGLPRDAFPIYNYPGGIVIQAGVTPEIGDRNRRLKPQNYPRVARLLKEIRVQEHDSLQASGGFDKEETLIWLARFEEDNNQY